MAAMRPGEAVRDERGLVGKLAVVYLLVLGLMVLAAFDAGSIALTKYKVTSAAEDAALQGATTFKETGDPNQAYRTAVKHVNQDAPGASIPKDGFAINRANGQVTVTVVKKASTLLTERLGFLKQLVTARATSTSGPTQF
jgi:uncharacterized membrane protein